MKKFKFLTVILSLMIFLCSFASCNFNSYELSLMSFNIRIPSGSGVQSWGSRKAAVMDTINNSGADIIGLQEVSSTPYSDFLILLAENYEIVYFQEHENLAIVYDKTVFNFVSQEKYWFSDTPDQLSNGWDGPVNYRAAVTLVLEHKATGEKVRAINTHGPLDDEGNVKAYELVANRSLSDETAPFTVMMGDFNATPNKLGYVPIAEKLQDCRIVAKESPNRESRTWNGYKDTSKGILDYCFVSKSESVEVLSYRVRDDKWGAGNYISDHFGVQVAVKMNSWTK